MRINDNIQTSIKYMSCLLFKRLYAAGLAWLSQGLGTKGTSLKQWKTGMGWGNYMWETRGSLWHGNGYQWNRGCRDEGWDKGNRDERRSVGDVMEMEWTWEMEGIVEDGRVGWTCRRCIGDWYLTFCHVLVGMHTSMHCLYWHSESDVITQGIFDILRFF